MDTSTSSSVFSVHGFCSLWGDCMQSREPFPAHLTQALIGPLISIEKAGSHDLDAEGQKSPAATSITWRCWITVGWSVFQTNLVIRNPWCDRFKKKKKRLQMFMLPQPVGSVVLKVKQRQLDLWPTHLVVHINRQAWERTGHKKVFMIQWVVHANLAPLCLAPLCHVHAGFLFFPVSWEGFVFSFIYPQILWFLLFYRAAKLSQREHGFLFIGMGRAFG